jgi:hypothetical protein
MDSTEPPRRYADSEDEVLTDMRAASREGWAEEEGN